jgi:hypothetical protein
MMVVVVRAFARGGADQADARAARLGLAAASLLFVAILLVWGLS